MQTIPITLADASMILARDVKKPENPDGPPICGKGMALTGQLIERLKLMGIQMVVVEGHPVWMEGDKTVEEQLALLDRRFAKVCQEPLMAKLKEIYRAYITKSMGQPG